MGPSLTAGEVEQHGLPPGLRYNEIPKSRAAGAVAPPEAEARTPGEATAGNARQEKRTGGIALG
jgi:hypothetical protein